VAHFPRGAFIGDAAGDRLVPASGRQRPIGAAQANVCCPPSCGRCASGRPAAGLDPTPAIQAPPCAWLRLPTRADVASQAGVTDFPAASCIRMPGERGTVVARRARASQPRNHDEHPTEPALLRSACVPAVDRLRWRDPRTRDDFAVTGNAPLIFTVKAQRGTKSWDGQQICRFTKQVSWSRNGELVQLPFRPAFASLAPLRLLFNCLF